MGNSHRPRRLGEEIKKILGDLLIRGSLNDPAFRNCMIGINDVDVSGDGSYATIYFTVLSYTPGKEFSSSEKQKVTDAFVRSSGFIRSEIGKKIKVRYVPELIFKIDTTFEYGVKMDRLLDSLDIKPQENAAAEPEKDEFAEEFD